MWAGDQELRERARRLETRLEEIEAFAEPECHAKSVAAMLLLGFSGDGLERIVEIIVLRDPGLLDLLVEDEMVSHLLLLHGLHPLDLDTRLAKALDQVRAYLQDMAVTWSCWVSRRVSPSCGSKAAAAAAPPRA